MFECVWPFTWGYAETVLFNKDFYTRKLGKITVFFRSVCSHTLNAGQMTTYTQNITISSLISFQIKYIFLRHSSRLFTKYLIDFDKHFCQLILTNTFVNTLIFSWLSLFITFSWKKWRFYNDQNTVILTLIRLCRNFVRARNYAKTVPFHKIYIPGNKLKFRYFMRRLLLNCGASECYHVIIKSIQWIISLSKVEGCESYPIHKSCQPSRHSPAQS